MNIDQIIILIVSCIVSGAIALLWKRIEMKAERHNEKFKTQELLTVSHTKLLYTLSELEIVRLCRDSMLKEASDRYILRTIETLYAEYKKIGGNGYVDDIINVVRSLPIDHGITEGVRHDMRRGPLYKNSNDSASHSPPIHPSQPDRLNNEL